MTQIEKQFEQAKNEVKEIANRIISSGGVTTKGMWDKEKYGAAYTKYQLLADQLEDEGRVAAGLAPFGAEDSPLVAWAKQAYRTLRDVQVSGANNEFRWNIKNVADSAPLEVRPQTETE